MQKRAGLLAAARERRKVCGLPLQTAPSLRDHVGTAVALERLGGPMTESASPELIVCATDLLARGGERARVGGGVRAARGRSHRPGARPARADPQPRAAGDGCGDVRGGASPRRARAARPGRRRGRTHDRPRGPAADSHRRHARAYRRARARPSGAPDRDGREQPAGVRSLGARERCRADGEVGERAGGRSCPVARGSSTGSRRDRPERRGHSGSWSGSKAMMSRRS